MWYKNGARLEKLEKFSKFTSTVHGGTEICMHGNGGIKKSGNPDIPKYVKLYNKSGPYGVGSNASAAPCVMGALKNRRFHETPF